MLLPLLFPAPITPPFLNLKSSSFLSPQPLTNPHPKAQAQAQAQTLTIASHTRNHPVRFPPLDRHASAHSRLRFARKLSLLLLSKPRHFLPLRHLRRCRRFLALPPRTPLIPFILRYPTLFHLYQQPSHSPLPVPHQTLSLAVRLSPDAAALFADLAALRSSPSLDTALACKLQRLLMLAHRSGHRLLLSKLVHLAPDLGFSPNFRSRLCNSHPDRFQTVDTSYGRAVELVQWDPELAGAPLPPISVKPPGGDRIIDRPLRFKSLQLRRGLNLKRKHRDYLIRLQEMPEVSPYVKGENLGGKGGSFDGESVELSALEEEKRACAVVREVLGMTVEKRTLIDHLTHFRKEFGLPNQLRGLLVRHPEMFYVSINGVRHSVFLVEAYDEKGRLVVKDELLQEKERLMELVWEGKRIRRERKMKKKKKDFGYGDDDNNDAVEVDGINDEIEEIYEYDDFRDLFESGIGDDWEETGDGNIDETDDDDEGMVIEELWVKKAMASGELDLNEDIRELEAW